ncbi:hypothetical protein EIP86_000604 [Pleurotus ostreatoroseus]|nr:hypothetical protein EIP86_000604 [Pleurotus ostreatoroseus]
MLGVMSDHILWLVASELDDISTLRSLSLVNSKFTAPARKVLFRDCQTVIRSDESTLHEFTVLVSKTPSISGAIVSLMLQTDDCKVETDIYEIAGLVRQLRLLTSLSLMGFEWKPSLEASLLFPPTLPCGESPLQILQLAKSWHTVCIDQLYCNGFRASLHGNPFVVQDLWLRWCSLHDNSSLGGTENKSLVKGLTDLAWHDATHQQLDLVQQLVIDSSASLKRFELVFSYLVEDLPRWETFFERMGLCTQLHHLHVAIILDEDFRWDEEPTYEKHIQALHSLARRLPPSVINLHINLIFGTCTNRWKAKQLIMAVTWSTLGASLQRHASLRTITITFELEEPGKLDWSAHESAMFRYHLRGFPFAIGEQFTMSLNQMLAHVL